MRRGIALDQTGGNAVAGKLGRNEQAGGAGAADQDAHRSRPDRKVPSCPMSAADRAARRRALAHRLPVADSRTISLSNRRHNVTE